MNQCHIQEKYLKAFTNSNELLWVYKKPFDKAPCQITPFKCNILEDFQSFELGKWQNETSILALRNVIKKKSSINEEEFDIIFNWLTLHVLRNALTKTQLFSSKEKFELSFRRILKNEALHFQFFKFCKVLIAPEGEFFISSDDPILELTIQNSPVFILPLSSKRAVVLTINGKRPFHKSMTFCEAVNSMQYVKCVNELYSDHPSLPISDYINNSNEWHLKLS